MHHTPWVRASRWVSRMHSCVWRDSSMCVTWLIHAHDTNHSYVRHDSFMCETWLIHVWDMTHSYVRHDSFLYETWLIHVWDMPHWYAWHDHAYVWHDSVICGARLIRVETWLIHTWDMTHSCGDMTHSYVRHDSFVNVTWLIQMCNVRIHMKQRPDYRESQQLRIHTQQVQPIMHVECHSISISNLNFIDFFATERGKRDLEN